MTEFCKIEREGHLTIVTLNRPDVMNALHHPAHVELDRVWNDFAADPEQWVGIVTGAGPRAFSAGNDLKYQAGGGTRGFVPSGFAGLTARQGLIKPIIAAVNGVAMGGGFEIALACDIIVAAESAKFALPEIKLAMLPGAGGTQRLPRAVGKAKAMDMCLSARMLSAQEADRYGLVSRVVPDAELQNTALKLATQIAGYSLPALMAIKESVNRAHESSLSEGILFERRELHARFASSDAHEGMHAFLGKRQPVFQHR